MADGSFRSPRAHRGRQTDPIRSTPRGSFASRKYTRRSDSIHCPRRNLAGFTGMRECRGASAEPAESYVDLAARVIIAAFLLHRGKTWATFIVGRQGAQAFRTPWSGRRQTLFRPAAALEHAKGLATKNRSSLLVPVSLRAGRGDPIAGLPRWGHSSVTEARRWGASPSPLLARSRLAASVRPTGPKVRLGGTAKGRSTRRPAFSSRILLRYSAKTLLPANPGR